MAYKIPNKPLKEKQQDIFKVPEEQEEIKKEDFADWYYTYEHELE